MLSMRCPPHICGRACLLDSSGTAEDPLVQRMEWSLRFEHQRDPFLALRCLPMPHLSDELQQRLMIGAIASTVEALEARLARAVQLGRVFA